MKISELIAFAEAQAKIEQKNPPSDDPDRDTDWTATLAVLNDIKEHGVPELLKDNAGGEIISTTLSDQRSTRW